MVSNSQYNASFTGPIFLLEAFAVPYHDADQLLYFSRQFYIITFSEKDGQRDKRCGVVDDSSASAVGHSRPLSTYPPPALAILF